MTQPALPFHAECTLPTDATGAAMAAYYGRKPLANGRCSLVTSDRDEFEAHMRGVHKRRAALPGFPWTRARPYKDPRPPKEDLAKLDALREASAFTWMEGPVAFEGQFWSEAGRNNGDRRVWVVPTDPTLPHLILLEAGKVWSQSRREWLPIWRRVGRWSGKTARTAA